MHENDIDYDTFTASQWADEIRARHLDAQKALGEFEQACASVLCPCCHGEDSDLAAEVGRILRERYDADPVLGDFLLGDAGDARSAFIAVIGREI